MKRFSIRITTAVCAFLIGIIAVSVWLYNPASISTNLSARNEDNGTLSTTPEASPDTNIYAVDFCSLIKDSNFYDGKIVRLQAVYAQGIDSASLHDSLPKSSCKGEWIAPVCRGGGEVCEKFYEQVNSSKFFIKVDIIGRFTDKILYPYAPTNAIEVHQLEILELIGAKTTNVLKE
jgi:hypothetical protein